ncbi:MAG: DUF4214 domain-containing protein [Acidobacteria bacterium]|nr:DUF4214 domain-containing protein [Acidobacteriota bacterium]
MSGTTTLVSVNRDRTGGGNESSRDPAISADGRYVAFVSHASDLVANDTNNQSDVFVRDLVEKKTTLVSVNRAGTDSSKGAPTLFNGAPLNPGFLSFWPLMSTDGRRIVFLSYADDLVENDTNNALDIFVRDMQTGVTSCVSVNRAGVPSGNRNEAHVSEHEVLGGFFRFEPVISADGRFVAFQSDSNDLVDNDTLCVIACNGLNGLSDVFIRDLVENKTTLVSVNRVGTNGGNSGSGNPVISADGRFVAFQSFATDLVDNDTTSQRDIYVRDMAKGQTTLVSVNRAGTNGGGNGINSRDPRISGNGRFVAFSSPATDLAPNKNDVLVQDVFVRDLATGMTTLVSVNRSGNDNGRPLNTNSSPQALSHDGRFIVFTGNANDLVVNDNNGNSPGGGHDVFVRDLAIGTTYPLNLNLAGSISNSGGLEQGRISADGRTLVFESPVSDLVENDKNNTWDVFARAAHPDYPIDDPQFFVAQHYRDFLNREPDPAGLAFWTNEMTSCGSDAQCQEVKRINVSAAFFLSIEFQQTGYFVYRTYQAAFNTGERLRRGDFLPDTQGIGGGVLVGQSGWELRLLIHKQRFADEFVKRPAFTAAYPATQTPAQFVDALNANTGGSLSQSERDALVSDLAAGRKTRAEVLRAVAEDADFVRREFNRAFVLMEYFGYLRRNPDDAPDTDFSGYNFWLSKLDQFNGNFVQAEMVKAFLASTEYRNRFGQP